jgi:integrase-like protein
MGKIERLHQTLQQELLNVHAPFASIEDGQAAVDTCRKQYNADRPHQSLAMAYPAARFASAKGDALGLRIPAELSGRSVPPVPDADPVPDDGETACPVLDFDSHGAGVRAVELDRVVPPSGNMWLAGQQIWLGPAMSGRTVRLWAGLWGRRRCPRHRVT